MIHGIGTYIPTMTAFAAHWSGANAASGTTPITLKGGYALANFNTDKAALQTAINASLLANQIKATATGNLHAAKRAIAPRLPQFNKAVQALLPNTGYADSLPHQPVITMSESKFLNPHQDMATLWANINADTSGGAVITLAGGCALANFNTELSSLRSLYAAYNAAVVFARSARRTRDTLLPPAVQRMKQYREIIQARFAATDAVYQSLPALNPSAGFTPAPAQNIAWEWDATLGKAKITFAPSSSADILHYVLRFASGAVYKVKHESAVATILPTATPLQFTTNAGLTNPNTTALFRIYAVTKEGREKGSATIAVVRGAASLTLTADTSSLRQAA